MWLMACAEWRIAGGETAVETECGICAMREARDIEKRRGCQANLNQSWRLGMTSPPRYSQSLAKVRGRHFGSHSGSNLSV